MAKAKSAAKQASKQAVSLSPADEPTTTTETVSANPQLDRLLNASRAVKIHRSAISLAHYNPRQIQPSARKKLDGSINRFGLIQKLVWNVRTGRLVGGHQRLAYIDKVAKSVDYELEVTQVDVDEKTEKAMNLALNNKDLEGVFDHELLADIASDLCEHDQTLLDAAGFDEKALHVILGDEFTPSWARQQAALEAPVVDTLNDIYETGRAAEKSRSQDSDSGEQDEDDESTGDPDVLDPQDATLDSQDDDLRESLAGKRKVYKDATTEEDNADVLLTIHAPNTAAIERLLALLGQEPGERYLPISAIFDALK